ncbi:MAG: hypothetical protein V3V97_19315 [Hyphomicrobiaceae bacterium]
MTRKQLHRTLATIFAICGFVLGISAAAKISGDPAFANIYDFLRDMSLILATAIAAYLAHVLQRRVAFLQSLREEWREIVDTKSILITFCDREQPSLDDYFEAYGRISRAIDYMRIVYANIGETDSLIGLYPYEPLHDMRKALERLDPRSRRSLSPPERAAARDAIWEAFNALREHFLDEFDLEEPTRPITQPSSRRTKHAGAELPLSHAEIPQTSALTMPPPEI